MKTLEKIWKFLDGKKTILASLFWALLPLMPLFFPLGVPLNVTLITTAIGELLTFVGLGHQYLKSRSKK